MHRGSCLCGTVKYEIASEIGPVFFCHCSRCRKANGAAFATNAPVAASDLRIVQGEASIRDFHADTGVHRFFCGECGSPLFSRRDKAPDVLRVRIGTLDTPLAQVKATHIFTASKAPWYEIHDQQPQYEESPPRT